jgi:hypothetical protein
VNQAPITWYSKRQNTVESSTFAYAEFIALKTAVDLIKGCMIQAVNDGDSVRWTEVSVL